MVSNLCTFGGTERVTANLASELSAFYDVSIITHWQNKDIVFKVDERVKIFNLYNEKKRFRYTFVDGTRRIKNYIENMGIEILLVIGRNNFLLPLLVKVCSDVKVIFCEHSTIAPLCNKNDTLNKGLIVKTYSKLIAKFSDAVVVLTDKEKSNYQKQFKVLPDRIVKIPNYIDDSFLDDDVEYDLANQNIITIGRIEWDKGLDMLLPIALKLKKYTGWKWNLYGSGDTKYVENLKHLVITNQLNNIQFMGTTSNVKNVINKASFFVLLSRYEGLPMVLLEAKAKKLPLVSFDINSGPSDIIRDGIDGYLIKPFGVNEMVDKICELIENQELRKRFSDNAHGNIDKFKKETIVKQWRELIDEL